MLEAPPGNYTYRWSTGETGPTITVRGTGAYRVTLTNHLGCDSTSLPVAVRVASHPRPTIGVRRIDAQAPCAGDTVQLDAGPDYSGYLWSTGDTTRKILVTKSGAYSLTVTNAFGCTGDAAPAQIVIEQHGIAMPEIAPSGATTFCRGGSVRLRATDGFTSYLWSNGATSQEIVVESSGSHTVTVTDSNGCTATSMPAVVVVHEPPVPVITADSPLDFCEGGSVTLRAPPGCTSYDWSTGERSETIVAWKAGDYRVSVIDSNGCEGTSELVTVAVHPLPVAKIEGAATICPGGAATLRASGGARYRWIPSPYLSCDDCPDPIARPAITTSFHVTAIDEYGCGDDDSVTVRVADVPAIVRAHIDRDHHAHPGTPLTVPVLLDDMLDSVFVDDLTFTILYRGDAAALTGIGIAGTLLDGWRADTLENIPGRFRARLTAPAGMHLRGVGTLLDLHLISYLGSAPGTSLDFEIALQHAPCTKVAAAPGALRTDSICGLSFRLFEVFGSAYALRPNRPNPFNPTTEIEFSIGLEGRTLMEIFDAEGRMAATLLDAVLKPGDYRMTWDATSYPSGIYYYRLGSGEWLRTGMMMLVR